MPRSRTHSSVFMATFRFRVFRLKPWSRCTEQRAPRPALISTESSCGTGRYLSAFKRGDGDSPSISLRWAMTSADYLCNLGAAGAAIQGTGGRGGRRYNSRVSWREWPTPYFPQRAGRHLHGAGTGCREVAAGLRLAQMTPCSPIFLVQLWRLWSRQCAVELLARVSEQRGAA